MEAELRGEVREARSALSRGRPEQMFRHYRVQAPEGSDSDDDDEPYRVHTTIEVTPPIPPRSGVDECGLGGQVRKPKKAKGKSPRRSSPVPEAPRTPNSRLTQAPTSFLT